LENKDRYFLLQLQRRVCIS